jgi:hypothetical protein
MTLALANRTAHRSIVRREGNPRMGASLRTASLICLFPIPTTRRRRSRKGCPPRRRSRSWPQLGWHRAYGLEPARAIRTESHSSPRQGRQTAEPDREAVGRQATEESLQTQTISRSVLRHSGAVRRSTNRLELRQPASPALGKYRPRFRILP